MEKSPNSPNSYYSYLVIFRSYGKYYLSEGDLLLKHKTYCHKRHFLIAEYISFVLPINEI